MGSRFDSIEIRRSVSNASIAGIAVAFLWLGDWSARFSVATITVIQWISRSCGGNAFFSDGTLHWAGLKLSWTEDCSGVQALFILLGMTIWACFQMSPRSFLLRVLLTVPMAVLANLIRVLAIAALRLALHPHWEGELFHFAIGFLSILPFVMGIARDKTKQADLGMPWLVYLVSILAACSTRIDDPGGLYVLLSTVGYLLGLEHSDPLNRPKSWWLMSVWLFAGLGVAVLRAESLWLPWLLICPPLITRRLISAPESWLYLLGTIPLIAAQSAAQVVLLLAVLWQFCSRQPRSVRANELPRHCPNGVYPKAVATSMVAVAAAFLAPMASEIIGASQGSNLKPPPGIMHVALDDHTYRLRTIGQPNDIAVFWHASNRQGRHHSIATCLSFRGISTESLADGSGAMHSQSTWLREWFILDGTLHDSYLGYVTRCFPPLTSHGVHIVLQASKATTSRHHFLKESERIAKQLHQAHLHELAFQESKQQPLEPAAPQS